MTDITQSIDFKYKNKALQVKIQQDSSTGKILYNATQVFKVLDLPPSCEPDKWLRSNDTKQFILTNSSKMQADTKVQTQALRDLFYDDKKQSRMKRLPEDIEKDFVVKQKGRSGGTYMVKELFLKYVAHLDKDLEWQIIEAFSKYGHLDKLSGNAKTNAFLDLASKSIEEKLPAEMPNKKERSLARLDGMIKQRSLTQILCSILFNYRFINDRELAEEFFRKVYVGIYQTCFGQNKEEMMELIERKSGLIRDFMSDDALDILNMAETTIQVQLSLAKRAGKQITWDFVYETIIDSCKMASSISFKYTDHIPFLHRSATTVFKKQIDITLNSDMSITKVSKKVN